MGILRLFLAISIVVAHAGPVFGVSLVDARLAVQMFYLLSGFSMAFVWYGKYSTSQNPARTFLVGRALRIYPQYFVVLVLTILLSVYAWKTQDRHPIATAINNPIGGFGGLWIYLQQITLVTMDLHFFFQRAADGTLAFCMNFHQGTFPPLHYYMFVPQAWLLGLQMFFYMLIPLVLPRPRLCAVLLVLSFALRIGWWKLGLLNDPWTHRFIPFEFGVFLLGVLSYYIYQMMITTKEEQVGTSRGRVKGEPHATLPWDLLTGLKVRHVSRVGHGNVASLGGHRVVNKLLVNRSFGWGILAAMSVIILCVAPLQRLIGEAAYWVAILPMVLAAPFVFHVTMKLKWDRYLGELSYPVYITHLLVMWVGEFLFGIPVTSLVYFALPVTIPASMLLLKFQDKFDDYRYSLIKKSN